MKELLSLQRPLGIFDSGIGGMSVMAALATKIQGPCYYVADRAYGPYGPRSKGYILERATIITQQLVQWGCQLVVVACNTATAAAIKELRQQFTIPFVGVEPYLNFLHQAALPDDAKLGALMTPATSASEKYHLLKQRLDPTAKIQDFALPNLASLIERAVVAHYDAASVNAIKEELKPLQGRGLTHVILGCTHYPLIAALIEEFLGVTCVGPSRAIAQHTTHLLAALQASADAPASRPESAPPLQIYLQDTTQADWATRINPHPYDQSFLAQFFYHP